MNDLLTVDGDPHFSTEMGGVLAFLLDKACNDIEETRVFATNVSLILILFSDVLRSDM